MHKTNKGITLVALVITIIVLIILAGVSINAVMNGGLIANAKDAKNEYTEGKEKEETLLVDLEVETDFKTKVTKGYKENIADISKYTPYLFKNGYLTGIDIYGNVKSFRNNLPVGYNIYTKDGEDITDENVKVATGMILKKGENKVGVVIILGDVYCDGKIGLSDVSVLNNARWSNNITLEQYFEIAADINQDGYVNLEDYNLLNDHFEGRNSIDQNKTVENREVILKSLNYYKQNYIENLPKEFTSEYKVYYSEQYKRYQIDVNKNEVTAEQFLSKLQDDNAKLKVYVEDEGGMVEKSDSTPITRAAQLYITFPEFETEQLIIVILAQ